MAENKLLAYSKMPCGCGGNIEVEPSEEPGVYIALDRRWCDCGSELPVGARLPEVKRLNDPTFSPRVKIASCAIIPWEDADIISLLRGVRNGTTGNKLIGGVMVDPTSATVILATYDALIPENQAHFVEMGINWMNDFAWEMVHKGCIKLNWRSV